MKYYMVKYPKYKTEFINIFDDIWIYIDTWEDDDIITERVLCGIARLNTELMDKDPEFSVITDKYFITQRILYILDLLYKDCTIKDKKDELHFYIYNVYRISKTRRGEA